MKNQSLLSLSHWHVVQRMEDESQSLSQHIIPLNESDWIERPEEEESVEHHNLQTHNVGGITIVESEDEVFHMDIV